MTDTSSAFAQTTSLYSQEELYRQIGPMTEAYVMAFNPEAPNENVIIDATSGCYGNSLRDSNLVQRTWEARRYEAQHYLGAFDAMGRRNPNIPTDSPAHNAVRVEMGRLIASIRALRESGLQGYAA